MAADVMHSALSPNHLFIFFIFISAFFFFFELSSKKKTRFRWFLGIIIIETFNIRMSREERRARERRGKRANNSALSTNEWKVFIE